MRSATDRLKVLEDRVARIVADVDGVLTAAEAIALIELRSEVAEDQMRAQRHDLGLPHRTPCARCDEEREPLSSVPCWVCDGDAVVSRPCVRCGR